MKLYRKKDRSRDGINRMWKKNYKMFAMNRGKYRSLACN